MSAKRQVGFLIVGAQKAGTTSLFEYVRRHPDVHMPPAKEIGFFSSDHNYARGWEWYSSIMFGDAPRDARCGEASVGYMGGTPDRRVEGNGSAPTALEPSNGRCEDVIPKRIRQHAPDAKLVCVLRDPVSRCLSHYRMAVLAGAEQRTFEHAITEMIEPEALATARRSITGSNGYIVRGEYNRILSGYWRIFPPEQLMVLFSSALQARPAEQLARVFDYIGVSPDFSPENLGVQYRRAAVARRLPGLDLYAWQARLSKARSARAMWRTLSPRQRTRIAARYEHASFRVEVWNARRGEMDDFMPESIRQMLISHYREDTEALAARLGVEAPWLANWGRSPSADAQPLPRLMG